MDLAMMSKFLNLLVMKQQVYDLTYNEDDDPMTIDKDRLGGFDITQLWRGKPLEKPVPSTVRLYVNANKADKTDYVPNSFSWPICSQRFIDLLLPLAMEDIQILDAPLFDLKTKTRVAGFKIMNVVRLLECLDLERSVMNKRGTCAITPVFKAARIPDTVYVFLAAESPYGVIFTEQAVQLLRGKGLRGVAFIIRKTS